MSINNNKKSFIALRNDFVLKVDDNRPILYPLDFIDTRIYILEPIEGFVLSLLTGEKTVEEINDNVKTYFPGKNNLLEQVLKNADEKVKKNPTQSGIGADGLLVYSTNKITNSKKYDPRLFVINPEKYMETMNDLKRRYRLKVPINLLTVPTHKCHTDCIYCYAERKKVEELPLERWDELINEAQQLGIQLIGLDNGDVLARRDGIAFLECLLKYKMHFLLSTKASISKNEVERLVNAGFSEKIHGVLQRVVQLSIDGVDENITKQIVGVSNYLERVINTFENFMHFGIKPKIKSVMIPLNADQPLKIVDTFYPRGARRFQFIRYTRSFYKHLDSLFLKKQHIDLIRSQIKEIQNKYPDIELAHNIMPSNQSFETLSTEQKTSFWNNRSGCAGGWSMLGIAPDGKAFLCEQMKLNKDCTVGDLKADSIMDVWNNKKMFNFIHPELKKFDGTLCYSCDDFETCIWEKGRCYRDSYFNYGTIYDSPPLCPKNTRESLRIE